ncbi:PucR family transcriptional regulator [Fodinicola acaciae]|uniref:PucR family transcriptional regulator n=1 Tax=Fodinicola acaciae TaxID=2681555 RepID=UPI0013D35894|nr:helix-turn-helix domain-containing protein [Fodinicola acaciae]
MPDPQFSSDNEAVLVRLAPAVARRLPTMLTEVRDLLVPYAPDYAQFLTDEFDEVLAAGQGFVGRLVELAERGLSRLSLDVEQGVEQTLFEEIGRAHCRDGRDLAILLSAYRAGARVAWKHVSDAALEVGVSPEVFAALAGAVFAAVDQLSTATLRGYFQEQRQTSRERDRLREDLAELLLSDRANSAAVRAAAARADWTLPREAAVVLVDRDNGPDGQPLSRLEDSCLRVWRPDVTIGIVPDPAGPGRRARLADALRGTGAVVGATVPLDRLPASLHIAEVALRLRRSNVLADDPLFAAEHLDAIIVHRDDRLLSALCQQCLAPLADLPRPVYDRLCETLACWLRNMGDRRAVAAELHIHPHTVRYRLGQLRELFGDALDDPGMRASLTLALAWGPPAQIDLTGGAEPEHDALAAQRPAEPAQREHRGQPD